MANRTMVLLLLACMNLPARGEEMSATVHDFVRPVLIRKEPCELLQIVLDAGEKNDVLVKSFTFSMAGTDDRSAIASLSVWSAGPKNEFAAKDQFGEATASEPNVRITGKKVLQPGKNVFWLACTLASSANLSHGIQAICTEVETSEGTVVPKIVGETRRHRIGVALRQAGEEGVHTYRIPALATTKAGTLLCAYDIRRRSSKDLQGDIDVGLSRSLDGGHTWEPMRVIMDMGKHGGLPEEQNGIGDPGILVDQETGEIFCFALWVHAKPETHQWKGKGSEAGFEIGKTAQFMLARSDDDGKSWSAPENLTRAIKRESWLLLAPSPQQGIQLADGTLVMPIQGRDGGDTFATILVSKDHGKNWNVAGGRYVGGNDCQAAELSDGSIMLNVRNGAKKRRAVVVTKDLGETWTPHPTHETIIEPTCNGSLYRWKAPAGDLLLFANPQSEKTRSQHTLLVSTDDGLTWPQSQRILLDEGRGFGYPSLSRVDDDHLGIVYEGSLSHLIFERIPRSELGSNSRKSR